MAPKERATSRFRLTRQDIKYLGLLGGGLCFVFWDVLLLQRAFLSGDHLIQHLPWAKFLQHSIRHFRFPWWTSQIQSGFPLLAEGQIGAFYPPNLFFLFFLPLRWAYSYEILFHFAMGALFFYLYVRRLDLSPRASFFSTIIFLFGSTRGGFFYNVTSQRVSVWFPLTLLLVDRILEKKSFRDSFLLGLVFAFQIFAGYIQIAIYSIAFTTLYFILRLIPIFKLPGFSGAARSLGNYGTAVIIGLAVSAIQWLPTIELSGYSPRAEASEALAYVGSPNPLFIMTLLFPDWSGFWSGGIYVGMLGLSAVIWSLYTHQTATEKLWFVVFLVALLLGLGKFSPLYILIVKVFKVYFFRVPSKFLFFATFSLAIIAGFGFEKFFQAQGNRASRELKKVSATVCSIFLILTVFIGVSSLAVRVFRKPALGVLEDYAAKQIYGHPYHPHSIEVYKERVDSYYNWFLDLTSLKLRPNAPTAMPIILFLSEGSILYFFFIRKKVKPMASVIFGLLCLDLFYYVQISARRDLIPFSAEETKSRLTDRILEDGDTFRVHILNIDPLRRGLFPFVPDKNMLLGIEDTGIYSPFTFSSYKKFLGELGGVVNDSLSESTASLQGLEAHRDILDRLNVKYLLSDVPLNEKALELIEEEKGIRLYRNKSAWPRVLYTADLGRLKFNSPRKVPILNNKEGSLVLQTEEFDKGYLVVSEQNYPGWKARLNGEIVEPIPLDNCLKAIPILKKTDRVELYYEQKHKTVLCWISLGSSILVLGSLWWRG